MFASRSDDEEASARYRETAERTRAMKKARKEQHQPTEFHYAEEDPTMMAEDGRREAGRDILKNKVHCSSCSTTAVP